MEFHLNLEKEESEMFKKLITVVVAATMAFLPFQGQLYAVTFTAEGTISGVSSFNAALKNMSDGPLSKLTYASGTGVATADGYVDITFNDNSTGFQAITIATDNRLGTADPKYSGIAQGNGLVGVTSTNVTVPVLWMTQATKGSGYTFTGSAPGEYYVTDLLQGTRTDNDPALGSSSCNDANKNKVCDAGEYDDLNTNSAYDRVLWQGTAAGDGNSANSKSYRCAKKSDGTIEYFADGCPSATHNVGSVEGIDWDGDGWDGAKPYSPGYASVVFGISGQSAELSAAAGAANTSGRTVSNGKVVVFTGVNYAGGDAQAYKTSMLKVELVTIA